MSKLCYDVYGLETVPVDDFLDTHPNNVVFEIDKEWIGINRFYLPINKQSIFWSCDPPLRKFARLALRDPTFVVFSEIEKVLKHDIRRIVLVFDHVEDKLQSNAVYEAKMGAGVSGKHCQAASGERVYRVHANTMKKIHTTAIIAKPLKPVSSASRHSSSQRSSSRVSSRSPSRETYARKYDVRIPTADLFDKSGRLTRRAK